MKQILEKGYNIFLDKICAALIGFFGSNYLLHQCESFLKSYIHFTMFLLSLGVIFFISSLFLTWKLYSISRKKMTNGILVDKNGVCLCPNCENKLVLQGSSFFCKKCTTNVDAVSEWDGTILDAWRFYAYQRVNPQKIIFKHELQNFEVIRNPIRQPKEPLEQIDQSQFNFHAAHPLNFFDPSFESKPKE